MAKQIPSIVPNNYYENLGYKTIQTPIALERMLNGPVTKVNNPLWPFDSLNGNPAPNRSANEADSGMIRSDAMPNYNQSSGLPSGYSELLKSARSQLVKLPDGSYVMAPQFGQQTSLEDIYRGIIPNQQQASGLASRKVQTVPIGPDGNPVRQSLTNDPQMAATNQGMRSIQTQGVQPARTEAMPPGARPAVLESLFAQMGINPPQTAPMPQQRPVQRTAQAWDPFGTSSRVKDETRLGASDPRMAFNPGGQGAALDAIDQLLGSGNSTQPRPNPFGYRAQAGKAAPQPMPGRPASISQALQGNQGNYTIKKGDTLTGIAKRLGTTVDALAKANNIKNPDKIIAGKTLNLGMAAPVPRQRTTSNQKDSRSERFTNLDQFGMIR